MESVCEGFVAAFGLSSSFGSERKLSRQQLEPIQAKQRLAAPKREMEIKNPLAKVRSLCTYLGHCMLVTFF